MQTKDQLLNQVVDNLIDLTGRGGFRQKDLAERLGVAETYLSQLKNRKNGKYPSKELAKQLALIYKENFPTDMTGEMEMREDIALYGTSTEEILGKNLTAAALNEAQKRHFQDVSDYLRYLVRQDLERPQARETSLSDVARAAANLLKNDLDSARRMAGDDNEN